MDSFSQADISRKYNVSRVTSKKWVELAQDGKNNLQLDLSENKIRILDNPNNEAELLRLSIEAKKYKNNIPQKNTKFQDEFYKLFSDEEVVEIYSDLKFKNQIKHKYVYKKPEYWNNLYNLNISPVSKSDRELIDVVFYDISNIFIKNQKVNIIDIGVGNADPVRKNIQNLLNNNTLNKYVGIDISEGMLELASNNLHEWFKDLSIVTYQKDLETSRLGKIFLDNKVIDGNISDAINLIIYLNGFCNLDDRIQSLKNLRSGMTDEDFLIIGFSLDTPNNRSQLNYIKDSESTIRDGWHLQMMGVDIENCQTTVEYDSKNRRKDKLYTTDKDYNLTLEISGKERIIELHSGDKISTWRHYLLTIEDFLFEVKQSDLEMVNLKLDSTCSYAVAICKCKTND